jgi:hypothetical protein
LGFGTRPVATLGRLGHDDAAQPITTDNAADGRVAHRIMPALASAMTTARGSMPTSPLIESLRRISMARYSSCRLGLGAIRCKTGRRRYFTVESAEAGRHAGDAALVLPAGDVIDVGSRPLVDAGPRHHAPDGTAPRSSAVARCYA